MAVSADKFVLQVSNETTSTYVRMTKEGRKITYKLNVIQQPERARACGSGAKSSADRRPVDPPPIVELRIYEGENLDEDITFKMNANYFLFATLEQARQLANGRVQQDPNRLTVLTGTPVAGLVYLDRPAPAGYFLFPDLSVRHEGKYRLSFNLYEEVKDEKDQDNANADENKEAAGTGSHVTHRLEVKSKPFIVYSAKKFPGLATSTDLSRLVAEQGCRVRIRRDVRMRKPDEKGGKEIDDYDDHTSVMGYAEPRRDHTTGQRSDSVSGQTSPVQSHAQDGSHAYPQHAPPAQPARSAYGQAHFSAPQYPYSHYHTTPSSYAASTGSHSQQPPSHYAPHPVQPPPQRGYYSSHSSLVEPPVQPPQPAAYDQQYQARAPAPSEPRPQSPAEYKASSTTASAYSYQSAQAHPVQPPIPPPYVSQQHHQQHPASYAPEHSRYTAPAHAPSRTASASHRMLPTLNTNYHHVPGRLLEASSPASAGPSPAYSEASRSFRSYSQHEQSGKRSYGDVFDTQHINGSMRGGARPSIGQAGHLVVDHDESSEDWAARMRMSYKRADGRLLTKKLPELH